MLVCQPFVGGSDSTAITDCDDCRWLVCQGLFGVEACSVCCRQPVDLTAGELLSERLTRHGPGTISSPRRGAHEGVAGVRWV
jgi:hypothetical protein